MSMPSTTIPVGEVVATRLGRSKVFERLGIDYCCGGKKTLAEACREKDLDTNEVLRQLVESDRIDSAESNEWTSNELTTLCEHIEQTHHKYLKSELPRLTELIGKVVAAHAERHSELREVQNVFAALRAELEPHMMKEERILFPAIRQLEQSTDPAMFPFGSLASPISVMEHEHDVAGSALEDLRRLTANFTPPDGACNTYRAMLDALHTLEFDLHQHIHKENNILFPRAQQLEQTGVA